MKSRFSHHQAWVVPTSLPLHFGGPPPSASGRGRSGLAASRRRRNQSSMRSGSTQGSGRWRACQRD